MTLQELLKATGSDQRDCEQCEKNRNLFRQMQGRGELLLDPEPVEEDSIGWQLALEIMPDHGPHFSLQTVWGSEILFACNQAQANRLREAIGLKINRAVLSERQDERNRCVAAALSMPFSIEDPAADLRLKIIRRIRGMPEKAVADARQRGPDEGR